MKKFSKFFIGFILILGGLLGVVGSIVDGAQYIEDDGDWFIGGLQVLYATVYIWIINIGGQLLRNRIGAANKAKWIFILQSLYVAVPNIVNWQWSMGLKAVLGYEQAYGWTTDFSIEAPEFYFHFIGSDYAIGLNFVAILLAWIAYRLHSMEMNAIHIENSILLEASPKKIEISSKFLLANKLFMLIGLGLFIFVALMLRHNSQIDMLAQQVKEQAAAIVYPPSVVINDLEWMRCAVGQKWEDDTCIGEPMRLNFDAAQTVASDLNANGGAHGKTDWRVPTIRELASLRVCSNGFQGEVDIQDGGPALKEMCADGSTAPTIDANQFPNTYKFVFWSSTPNSSASNLVWVVYTNVGGVFNDGNRSEGSNFVRLVRNNTNQSAAPQTVSTQTSVPAHTSTELLEPNGITESTSPTDSQRLELVTIKNKPLCTGEVAHKNCNFTHGETMECMRLFMSGNYDKPTQQFCKNAAFFDNNPDIYFALARLYQNGVFGPQENKLAAEWYEKAAKLGHAVSQNNLGVMYYYGDGVEKNTDLAITWLNKAAAQGLDEAKQSVEKLKPHVIRTQSPVHTENRQAESHGTSGQVHGLNSQGDGFLAVRAEPATNSAEVAKLHEGDKVLVLQESDNWLYIVQQSKSIRGWSHKNWIQLDEKTKKTSDSQRFIAQNDIVKDSQTGLIWQRCSVGQTWDGSVCTGNSKRYSLEDANSLAKNGWRMPTIRELLSLRECSEGVDSNLSIDIRDGGNRFAMTCNNGSNRPTISAIFSNTTSEAYWSATNYFAKTSDTWFMSFNNGLIDTDNRRGIASIRLVRNGDVKQ